MLRSVRSQSSRVTFLALLIMLTVATVALPSALARAESPAINPISKPAQEVVPTAIPTPAPAPTSTPAGLVMTFKGSLDAVDSGFLIVSGTKIWHDGNIPTQVKAAPLGSPVVGSAVYGNGDLTLQLIGLYTPNFDGVVDSITVPNAKGEYFVFVNGAPLLMKPGIQVQGGNLVEGIRVAGKTSNAMNAVETITVVTPFPLDILSGNAAYPWPIYALFALWLPVLGLVMIMVMSRNKKAVANEENEVAAVEEQATTELDPEELREEQELQALEETEQKEQASFDEVLNQYAEMGITLRPAVPATDELPAEAPESAEHQRESAPLEPTNQEPVTAEETANLALAGAQTANVNGSSRRRSAREEFLARHKN